MELQNNADKKYREVMWVVGVRKEIETYELNFRRPKKGSQFEYDQTNLTRKLGYDHAEAERYQRWMLFLENPPSTQVEELVARLEKAKMSFEEFSELIVKTYRETSVSIHEALRVLGEKQHHFKVSYRISRIEAIDILMGDVEFYKPEKSHKRSRKKSSSKTIKSVTSYVQPSPNSESDSSHTPTTSRMHQSSVTTDHFLKCNLS